MGGRGTFSTGENVAYKYKTVEKIEGVKVLKGINGKQSLPETAHSSSAYIKLDHNGNFHEMRLYDKNHCLYMEIAYHKEEKLTGNNQQPILHYHIYDSNFSMSKEVSFYRSDAMILPDDLKEKYKKYFRGIKI